MHQGAFICLKLVFIFLLGYLEKYRKPNKILLKGFTSKWQRRYCVLTPLALYYYENKNDQKQKGQIILPSSDCKLRKGNPSFSEVKDGKLCFELATSDRCFLVSYINLTSNSLFTSPGKQKFTLTSVGFEPASL